jgi:regulator of sigma E protease
MSWLLAFAGFAALIILHEFGHFAAAKAVGMRVERFALFFPPLIWKVRRGETEYGIGSIPLGGYVRITGMNPNEEIPPEVAHRAYYRQPVWKRVVVILAGPVMNVLIAFVILWALFWANGTQEPTTKVDRVQRGQPATGVLRPGDEILSIDGVSGGQRRLALQTASHHCAGKQVDGCAATTPVRVRLRRNGVVRTLSLRPVYDKRVGRTRLGFSFGVDVKPAGPGRAVHLSLDGMWRVTKASISAIARIFDPERRKELSSVVGAFEVQRQAISFDTTQALNVLAIISLSLAIINLFPFLPLDGGHVFWALAEKVRGRAIPFQLLERASIVGFMLVLTLFVIGLSNDIDRLRGEGFGLR